MSQFNRAYRGNAFAMLHWAYAVEKAQHGHDAGPGYGAISGTSITAGVVALGVQIDRSDAATMSAANNSHADAMLAHDVVMRVAKGRTLGLIIQQAEMGIAPVLPPVPVARVHLSPIEACPQKGTTQGWPMLMKIRGQGKRSGFTPTETYSQHLEVENDPRKYLRGALVAQAWLTVMKQVEAQLYQAKSQLQRWELQGTVDDLDMEAVSKRVATLKGMCA